MIRTAELYTKYPGDYMRVLILLLISVCSFGQAITLTSNQGIPIDLQDYLKYGPFGEIFITGSGTGHAVLSNNIDTPEWVTVAGMKREELSYNGIKYLKYTPTTMPIRGAVLFLHGMGERGSNLALLENTEIPKQLKNGLEVPYIVVAPQLPSGYGGWYGNITGPIIEMMKGYGVDLHLAGLSLGGMSASVIGSVNFIIYDTLRIFPVPSKFTPVKSTLTFLPDVGSFGRLNFICTFPCEYPTIAANVNRIKSSFFILFFLIVY